MASSSAPVHPARYLSVFLVMLIGIYLLVFFTGDKHTAPKLGIDLQGGTRVTLTARTPDGSAPSREALAQAQQIISARVNGLGVSGSEVVVDGDNLVITVPGNDGSEARNLGQTARLYIRPCSTRCRRSPQPKNRSRHPAPNRSRPVNPPHRRQPNRGRRLHRNLQRLQDAGKTKRAALRCLKRRLARTVFQALRTVHQPSSEHTQPAAACHRSYCSRSCLSG